MRLKEEIKTGKIKGKRPTLRPLLQYAVDHGLVKNKGFSAWQNRGEINSRKRVEMEKLREAIEMNLDKITCDESEIQITAEDLDWNYVKVLADFLPLSRNEYAHGSTNLYPAAAPQTIRIISEIINQLYEL
jgi:hypothetical protein